MTVEALANGEPIHTWSFYVARKPRTSEHPAQSARIDVPTGPDGKPTVVHVTAWLQAVNQESARVEMHVFNMGHEGKRVPTDPIECPYAAREVVQVWKTFSIRVSYADAG